MVWWRPNSEVNCIISLHILDPHHPSRSMLKLLPRERILCLPMAIPLERTIIGECSVSLVVFHLKGSHIYVPDETGNGCRTLKEEQRENNWRNSLHTSEPHIQPPSETGKSASNTPDPATKFIFKPLVIYWCDSLESSKLLDLTSN